MLELARLDLYQIQDLDLVEPMVIRSVQRLKEQQQYVAQKQQHQLLQLLPHLQEAQQPMPLDVPGMGRTYANHQLVHFSQDSVRIRV